MMCCILSYNIMDLLCLLVGILFNVYSTHICLTYCNVTHECNECSCSLTCQDLLKVSLRSSYCLDKQSQSIQLSHELNFET